MAGKPARDHIGVGSVIGGRPHPGLRRGLSQIEVPGHLADRAVADTATLDDLSLELRGERPTGRGFFRSMVSMMGIFSGVFAPDGECPSNRSKPTSRRSGDMCSWGCSTSSGLGCLGIVQQSLLANAQLGYFEVFYDVGTACTARSRCRPGGLSSITPLISSDTRFPKSCPRSPGQSLINVLTIVGHLDGTMPMGRCDSAAVGSTSGFRLTARKPTYFDKETRRAKRVG